MTGGRISSRGKRVPCNGAVCCQCLKLGQPLRTSLCRKLHLCELPQEAVPCSGEQRPFRIKQPGAGDRKSTRLNSMPACLVGLHQVLPKSSFHDRSLSRSVAHECPHGVMSEVQQLSHVIFPGRPCLYQQPHWPLPTPDPRLWAVYLTVSLLC